MLISPLPCCASDPRPNDSIETARVFGFSDNSLAPNLTPPPDWQISMEHDFKVLDVLSGNLNTCTGRIFLITDHIVFWYDIREGIPITAEITDRLIRFDRQTLPMLRETFGNEDNPGVDNDPRFHVVFTDRIGEAYNGYFSAGDGDDPRIRPASNGMDLLFLNTRLLRQSADAVIDTLSHEFQHMIHHHYDANEPSFINEGLSQLAEYLALGKYKTNFIRSYLNDTGKSLIWWPDSGTTAPYYGSSFLFSVYLYDRFGKDFILQLTEAQENGLNGLDEALRSVKSQESADDLFQQWTAALSAELLESPLQDWGYRTFPFPQDGIYRDIKTLNCGTSELHETAQYGIRLYNSSCGEPFSITITGNAESPLTNLPIPEGQRAWWSGAVSNSMSLLSRSFDLRKAASPIYFEYDINYAIENGYDYYYLLLTDENGAVIRLKPSTATEDDPAGQNLGWGTTGRSDGLIHERIDLNEWIGQRIRLTFVYLTDTAGLGDGMLLDRLRIDAIGFRDDAETNDNGWESEGFSRISTTVPQRFSLTVLHPQQNGEAKAEFFSFVGGESFSADCPEGACTFAVSPISRGIRSRASFAVQTNLSESSR